MAFFVIYAVSYCAMVVQSAQGANILLASLQQPSHILEIANFGDELARRGHSIYIVTDSKSPLSEEIERRAGFHVLNYNPPDTMLTVYSYEMNKQLTDAVFSGTRANIFKWSRKLSGLAMEDCKAMMQDTEFLIKLKSIDFKIAVIDGFFLCPCKMVLPFYLDIPFVLESGAWNFDWVTRSPLLPSIVPCIRSERSSDRMSFKERVSNFINCFSLFPGYKEIFPGLRDTSLIELYAPNFTRWGQLAEKASLFFITRDHLLDWPQPHLPTTISVPALVAAPVKSLPQSFAQLQKWLDDSELHGVILVGFGSTILSCPPWFLEILRDAFSQVPHTVLFKYSPDIPQNITFSSNVHFIRNWYPQNDVMGHRNTRIFITHCGNNGQYEALYHAVPMIGIPMFAEQQRNAFRAEAHGYGIDLKAPHMFSASDLVEAITELSTNSTYQINVMRASQILKSAPRHPKERVADAIETAMEFGVDHLRSAAFDLEWYQYFMIDIIGTLAFIVIILLGLSIMLINIIMRRMTSSKVHHLKSD